jgi:hypothetical protein
MAFPVQVEASLIVFVGVAATAVVTLRVSKKNREHDAAQRKIDRGYDADRRREDREADRDQWRASRADEHARNLLDRRIAAVVDANQGLLAGLRALAQLRVRLNRLPRGG